MSGKTKIVPVVLSGGSGTRLWPLSRAQFPKQLIPLVSDMTMLQETVLRLSALDPLDPIVVCNEAHRFIIAEQLLKIGSKNPSIVLEPVARNTAPAIVAAALQSKEVAPDAVMVVLPSDHSVRDAQAFASAVEKAVDSAADGSLVTFGVNPTFASTGYGYINASGKIDGNGSMSVKRFVEKPNFEKASEYLDSFRKNGDYFWNSGMFVFRADSFLEEAKRLCPEVVEAARNAFGAATVDLDFIRLGRTEFEKSPSISIDYAVMEKTEKARVVPLDAGWSDVGSWSSLWDASEKDSSGNAVRGEVLLEGVKDSLVYSSGRTVSVLGLEGIVVVDTKDALLVADRSKSEDVKKIVDALKERGSACATESEKGYRPWGEYETIELGERYRVKHITVKPGQRLSVQMHYHRAEHWIVVSGTAKVRNGEKEFILTENQSTFIPLGTVHAIENPGKLPLEFIEVQSGGYLEEDDIVRFEDKYGRC